MAKKINILSTIGWMGVPNLTKYNKLRHIEIVF